MDPARVSGSQYLGDEFQRTHGVSGDQVPRRSSQQGACRSDLGSVRETWTTTACVARDFEQWGQVSFDAHDLMQRALEAIHRSAAVVVEFTEKGVGLGIEADYAAALDIPVFVLLRPEAEMSTTLVGISTDVFRYADDDSLNSAATRIANKIGRARERP